ncbi:MAG: hypothetical protein M3H12_14970, partial [Chromatiales bacterium]
GMLRAAYAYCGLPAFVSLSMAGSEGVGKETTPSALGSSLLHQGHRRILLHRPSVQKSRRDE